MELPLIPEIVMSVSFISMFHKFRTHYQNNRVVPSGAPCVHERDEVHVSNMDMRLNVQFPDQPRKK